ncbi:MAG: UbiA family prenyltransferase [Synergistaceae bacterium]|nr:UbiA family prenyltransferase [Synergistaceae bacterium]
MDSLLKFVKAYVKSMRLYYAFITGISGWVGVSFYEYVTPVHYSNIQVMPSAEKKLIILTFLFMCWGINQIFNDYMGLAEGRINAPNRPMVTGELNAAASLLLSTVLLAAVSLATYYYLEPLALFPLLTGVGLNFIYEHAKGYGILGNIVYGLTISSCSVFGFLACGPVAHPLFTKERVSILVMMWLLNALMTYFTYFKDYEGDKAAGKRTIIVKYGLEKSKLFGVISSFLPSVTFIAIYMSGCITVPLTPTFWILAILTLFLELWNACLYYVNPGEEKTSYSLATNTRACVCGQTTFIAIYAPQLATLLFLVSYIFIGFLFDLHKNSKE